MSRYIVKATYVEKSKSLGMEGVIYYSHLNSTINRKLYPSVITICELANKYSLQRSASQGMLPIISKLIVT